MAPFHYWCKFIVCTGPVKQIFFQHKIAIIFLSISLNICYGCSKEPSHLDGSFEYRQHMLWMRNKEDSFPIHTSIWKPDMDAKLCRTWLAIFIRSQLIWICTVFNRKKELWKMSFFKMDTYQSSLLCITNLLRNFACFAFKHTHCGHSLKTSHGTTHNMYFNAKK